MIPLPEPDPEAPLTPGFALLLTLIAALLQVMFVFMFHGAQALIPALIGMATIVGFGCALFIAAPRIPDPPALHLGFVRAPRLAWLAILFLVFSLLLISEADNWFQQLFPLPDELLDEDKPTRDLSFLVTLGLVQILILPLAEELLFRGFIQPRLAERWSATSSILFTSVLNALASFMLNRWSLASVFTSALVLGIVRHCTRSLWPSLVLHGIFGAISVLASYAVFGIPGFDDLDAPHTPLLWLAPAVLLSGIGFALCRAVAVSTRTDAVD